MSPFVLFSPPADFSSINGRRESQGSLSSGASLELGTSGKLEVGLPGTAASA